MQKISKVSIPKSKFDTLECTLEEIAVFELIFKNHFYAGVSTDIHCKNVIICQKNVVIFVIKCYNTRE